MTLPALLENGYLPPGLHLATLGEIEDRFGRSTERRRELFARLRSFVELARHVRALRMFVNGSYVTAKPYPGDVDVVIWVGDQFLGLLDQGDEQALSLELMFLSREPREAFAVFDEDSWNTWAEFFSSSRRPLGNRKGLVEVRLR